MFKITDYRSKLFLLNFLLIFAYLQGSTSAPPPIGNFSLPASQQPYGLFAFGGNIIDKGEVQLIFFADDFEGKDKETVDLISGVLFGITEECSIFFNFPFTPKLRDDDHESSR